MKTAKDVMNTEIVTISSECNFLEVLNIMKEKGIGRVPVIENGNIIGVVTREDILIKEEKAPIPPVIAFWDIMIAFPGSSGFDSKLKKITGYQVKEIMSTNFLRVKEDDKLEDIITDILEKNYGYAVVVDSESRIKGLITKTDLINKSF